MLMLSITNTSAAIVSICIIPNTPAIVLNPQESIQLHLAKLRKDWQSLLKSMKSVSYQVIDSNAAIKPTIDETVIASPLPNVTTQAVAAQPTSDKPTSDKPTKAVKREVVSVNEVVSTDSGVKNVSESATDKKRA